jgi:acyl transferase domain-containing protein
MRSLVIHPKRRSLDRDDTLVDTGLVVAVPAVGSYPPDQPRSLYESSPVARCVFDEALQRPLMPSETELFSSYRRPANPDPTALTRTQRCAELIFMVALYRHFDSVCEPRVKPTALVCEGLGFLTGLVLSGAIGLNDGLRLWDNLYVQSAFKYSLRRYRTLRVSGVQPQDFLRLTEVGRPEIFYVQPGPICYLSGRMERMEYTLVGLEQHAAARAEFCNEHQPAPFHLRSFRTQRPELERYLSRVVFEPPDIPIYSTIPGAGLVRTPVEIRQALLHMLFTAYRWDRILEQLLHDGPQRLLCLGCDGGNLLPCMPSKLLPLSTVEDAKTTKARILANTTRTH